MTWTGRLAGPPAAAVVYYSIPAAVLPHEGRATAALGLLMATWWITSAMPLWITALLPVALFPLTGVGDITEATSPYANDIIFLFGGGFMLAQAVQRWGLHRRIALMTVLTVGTSPRRLIGGFMLAAGVLSMWVSNTATVVMMLPIGLSVLTLLHRDNGAAPNLEASRSDAELLTQRRFATSLMLAIAYAASIGSVATIIGTPPNGILAGWMADQGTPIGFGRWMLLGVPLAATFGTIAWLLLTHGASRTPIVGGRTIIERSLRQMGAPSRGERLTMAVFVAVAVGWMTRPLLEGLPGLAGLTDPSIAIGGAIMLFVLPVDWRKGVMVLDAEHARKIPWDILVLFGGGLSLAAAIERNGVAAFIGTSVGTLDHLSVITLIAVVATIVVLLTEVSSNTATAAVLIPILAATAAGLGLDPLVLAVPATLVATFAFMLPVATPPNAIVFGSGLVTVGQMVRAGAILNVVGVGLSTAAMLWLAPRVFGFQL
ncbi:MAG: SLC13 family permease [Nitriliruptoraceae bacterium]